MNGGTEMDVREKSSNGKRLIDYYYLAEHIECPGEPLVYWYDIEAAPTVDAVEVVRCRECKHRGTDDCIFHIKGEPADEELLLKLDNDFCSYGERKEGAD